MWSSRVACAVCCLAPLRASVALETTGAHKSEGDVESSTWPLPPGLTQVFCIIILF